MAHRSSKRPSPITKCMAYLLFSDNTQSNGKLFPGIIPAREALDAEINKRRAAGETVGGKILEMGATVREIYRRGFAEKVPEVRDLEAEFMSIPPKSETQISEYQRPRAPMPKAAEENRFTPARIREMIQEVEAKQVRVK